MQLYLLRHAIAASRDSVRFPDDRQRPLTPEGRKKMKLAARGMVALGLNFDLILTSPLTRARQTARIVEAAFTPKPPVRVRSALGPGGSSEAILESIPRAGRQGRVMVVGHEPDLSLLAAALLWGESVEFPLDFKKGGLCRIDFRGAPEARGGVLVWHLAPKILRALARTVA